MNRVPIILYRDVLLPLSETFVAAAAPMLTRYDARFTGTRMRAHPLLDRQYVIAPNERGALNAFQQLAFKAGGIVPNTWIERMRAHQPRLLHAYFGPDGIFATPIARRLNVPLVVTFLGFDATVERAFGPLWTVYKRKRRTLFRSADRILAVSEFIRSRLIEAGCPPERVVTHHLSVDTSHFQRDAHVQRERAVVFVGRLVEKKGCGDLIEAMRRVHEQDPHVRLRILGDGPLRAALERQAHGMRGVTFLGPRPPDEVRREMEQAMVFALPSRTAASGDSEGLPVVILEAQSMELPVVSTRHAGIPEAVLHGQTGLLCAEGDVDALAANILRLMRDDELRRAMGVEGRRRMAEHFDLRRQTAKLETIYDEVIARA
jgi:colanic acid/amylovoran biosynthesis glycosyltransferase